MQWHEISTALSRMAPPFPLAAAEEARQRWDELAPYFVAELERVAAGGSTLLDEINGEYDGLFSFGVYLAGKSVEFTGRVLSDPRSAMKNPPAGKPGSSATTVPNLPPEVLAEAIEKVLHRTYANWSDEPIPALGGKTPRQALATATGRERVRGLLRSYAAGEKDQAAQQGRRDISYAFLWEALGLDRAAK